MRYILIDLSSDNYLQQSNLFGGYEGEHNETILQVKLPKRMIDVECSGYRFDFQTSEDNKIFSPLIPVSELNNDVLSFHLTQQLTIAGKLLFNVVAILSDENTVSLISKTNTVTLRIEDAVDGNMQLIDPNGYKDELQKMVDERIMEINPANVDQTYTPTSENAQSGKAVAEAVSTEEKRSDNTFSNALKGTASGSEIFLTDVSPIVHDMNVSVSSNSISDLSVVKVIKKNGAGKFISEYIANPDGTVDGVTSFVGNEKKGAKIWDGSVSTGLKGTGSQDDPYLIESAADLAYFAKGQWDTYNNKYTKLMTDIYLNDVSKPKWYNGENLNTWEPGKSPGNFDGNGHVIHGIYINDSTKTNAGLFDNISTNVEIKISNLGIENSYISINTTKNGTVGALFALAAWGSSPTIENCYSSDTVILKGYNIGGLAGFLGVSVTFNNCYSSAQTIPSTAEKALTGGFVADGISKNNIFNTCYSSQDFPFIRYGYDNSTFTNCYTRDNSYGGGKVLSIKEMTGEAAYENMSGFDFNTVWYVNEYEFPKLRVFAYDAISLTSNTDNVKIYCEYNKDTKVLVDSKENISNKTNFLSLHSTDKEYPTAKAVYDAVHQTAETERNYADSTFTTITAFNALKSIVNGKKVTYRDVAQNEKLIIEKSKVYIFKAYPSDKAAINLWVTDSSGTETQAYSEGDKLFSDCTTGILIFPADTYRYSGILLIGITGKLSFTNLSPFYASRFANWLHSDIKNLFLKSTASDGMAVWTIAL